MVHRRSPLNGPVVRQSVEQILRLITSKPQLHNVVAVHQKAFDVFNWLR